MALAEELAQLRDESKRLTARGFVQVAWACIQNAMPHAPDEDVDAALDVLARVELARVDARDEGRTSFGFDTFFGSTTWHVTPDGPDVNPLLVLLGAFASRDRDVLDRAAAWTLRPDVRRPRNHAWFAPTLVDLVLAQKAGRDTTALMRTAQRIVPASHHAFVSFVEAGDALQPQVRALGGLWELAARLLVEPTTLSGSYRARRDALDAEPSALVQRLNAFAFAPPEEVLAAIFSEADELGLSRVAVASEALAAFVASSNDAIPWSLRENLRGVSWSTLVRAHDLGDDPRVGPLFALATPTRDEALELLARPSAPHAARTQALVALERWPDLLEHATRDEVHARARALLGTNAPRDALRALARSDDADATALKMEALRTLGEPTLAMSAALATRTHPHDPLPALAMLAELEPNESAETRAAAMKPDFVSLAWVHAVRNEGASAHAYKLAHALRLQELLEARRDDPELLFVALDQACAPSSSRHSSAATPASDLRRVLDALTQSLPDSHERVAKQTREVAEPSLREVLDVWLERATAEAAPPPPPPVPTEKSALRVVGTGVVRRKRKP